MWLPLFNRQWFASDGISKLTTAMISAPIANSFLHLEGDASHSFYDSDSEMGDEDWDDGASDKTITQERYDAMTQYTTHYTASRASHSVRHAHPSATETTRFGDNNPSTRFPDMTEYYSATVKDTEYTVPVPMCAVNDDSNGMISNLAYDQIRNILGVFGGTQSIANRTVEKPNARIPETAALRDSGYGKHKFSLSNPFSVKQANIKPPTTTTTTTTDHTEESILRFRSWSCEITASAIVDAMEFPELLTMYTAITQVYLTNVSTTTFTRPTMEECLSRKMC